MLREDLRWVVVVRNCLSASFGWDVCAEVFCLFSFGDVSACLRNTVGHTSSNSNPLGIVVGGYPCFGELGLHGF